MHQLIQLSNVVQIPSSIKSHIWRGVPYYHNIISDYKWTIIFNMLCCGSLQSDGEKVISGSYDHSLKVWDVKCGQCRVTLRYEHTMFMFADSSVILLCCQGATMMLSCAFSL